MSHSPIPCEADCLLNRFHNHTVLKKYGSSQKGLRTRKKAKAARFGKLREHESLPMEATNIIDFATDILGLSVASALQLIVAAVTVTFVALSDVCRSVVISSSFFLRHDLIGQKSTRKRVSSRQPGLIVNFSVAYVVVFLFLSLPCTAATHNRSITWCEKTSRGSALATTAAIAVVSKTNIKKIVLTH